MKERITLKIVLNRNGTGETLLPFKCLPFIFIFFIVSCGGGGGGGSSPLTDTGPTPMAYENSPFGFHPALVDRPDYTNNGYYDAQNIGVRWTRPSAYAFWINVQPDLINTNYSWVEYDELYGNLPKGLNILANVDVQAKSDESTTHRISGSYLLTDEQKYINFVKSLIERYDGDGISDMEGLSVPIRYWQVSNEPDVTGNDFAKFMKMTYLAIKEACPDCYVLIGGATSSYDADVNSYIENFNNTFLPILTELNGNYIDIFDFHWYGNAEGDYKQSKDFYEHISMTLSQTSFPEKMPIWITEMASYSGTIIAGGDFQNIHQTEFQQAADYLKRFIFPLSFGIKKVFPAFGLMEGFKGKDGYFDHTGLIYDGAFSDDLGMGVKKLGYYTYKLLTDKLEGADWDNIRTVQESGNVYIYEFTKDNNPVYVIWWDYFDEPIYYEGDTKVVALNIDFSGNALITEAVPSAETGMVLKPGDYPNFFGTKIEPVFNGQLIIRLEKSPVFVEQENVE